MGSFGYAQDDKGGGYAQDDKGRDHSSYRRHTVPYYAQDDSEGCTLALQIFPTLSFRRTEGTQCLTALRMTVGASFGMMAVAIIFYFLV
jgi:hypothetical protein